MGARTDALRAAIDAAWQAFDLPTPATTGVCQNCCMDPAIEADFLNRPARDLPDAYIRDWYFAACDAGISHAHVAWFLPRVLEMLAAGRDVASVGAEVTFSRLPLTGFPDRWPDRQVRAVTAFARAWFDALIHGDLPGPDPGLDPALCMFGEGAIDILPLLALLDGLSDAELAGLLHREWVFAQAAHIGFTAFWGREPARAQAWAWYTSEDLLNRMERAAYAGHEQAFAVHDAIARARADLGH
ncbi:MAG: hypothetical protein R3D63_16525 [Paracoccaceae bacterium]